MDIGGRQGQPAAEQPVFTKRKALERRFLEEAERNYPNYVATKTARGAGAATGDATVQAVDAAGDARRAPQSPDTRSSRSRSAAPGGIIAPSP